MSYFPIFAVVVINQVDPRPSAGGSAAMKMPTQVAITYLLLPVSTFPVFWMYKCMKLSEYVKQVSRLRILVKQLHGS